MNATTFPSPGRPLVQRLAEKLEPLTTALRQIAFGHSLQEVSIEYRMQREPIRQRLLIFENELERNRKAVAARYISISSLHPSLQEWVGYERKHFYIQLSILYRNQGFHADAERVLLLSEKGGKYTSEVRDEHGNFTGTETFTADKGKTVGNAVEVEL